MCYIVLAVRVCSSVNKCVENKHGGQRWVGQPAEVGINDVGYAAFVAN